MPAIEDRAVAEQALLADRGQHCAADVMRREQRSRSLPARYRGR